MVWILTETKLKQSNETDIRKRVTVYNFNGDV